MSKLPERLASICDSETIRQMTLSDCEALGAMLFAEKRRTSDLGRPLPPAWHVAFRAMSERVFELSEKERAPIAEGYELAGDPDSKGRTR